MKKNVLTILAILVLSLYYFSSTKIGITAIVEHPSLEAAKDGIVEELESHDLVEGKDYELVYQTAQGNMNTAVTIAKQFGTLGMDIVVGISTPSAQACMNSLEGIPVVFTAVTDPVSAGLIVKMGMNPNSNVVGISDMTPVNTQLKLIKLLMKDAEKIGFLYNPGEANSVILREHAQKACDSLGFELIEITGTTAPEMISAINSVASAIDVIYIGTDNTAASSIESISSVAANNNIPIVVGDIIPARNGGTIGFGFDYRQIGRETGKLVYEIMNGKKPEELESRLVDSESLTLYINLDIAEKVGMEVPESLLAKADFIVKDGVETAR